MYLQKEISFSWQFPWQGLASVEGACRSQCYRSRLLVKKTPCDVGIHQLEGGWWKAFLGGGFKYVFFHPYLWKIPSLTNILQGFETINQFWIFIYGMIKLIQLLFFKWMVHINASHDCICGIGLTKIMSTYVGIPVGSSPKTDLGRLRQNCL